MVDNNRTFTSDEFRTLGWNGLNDNSFFRGSDGLIYRRSSATVTVDSMNIEAEMSEATGQDYYVTTTNLGDGVLTIGFDDASSFTVAGALALQDIVKVENKTQGWIYITKGATVGDTSILLVAGNQTTGYPVPGASDEFEIVYRGIDRIGASNALLTTIDADTNVIQGDTTSLDAKAPALGTAAMAASRPVTLATDDTQYGAVGAAADVDGNIHAQLRYIGEAVDGLEGSIPTPTSTHKSPSDFSAAYTSSTTITLSGLPFSITDDSQITYIKYIPTGGSGAAVLVSGQNGVTITESSSVLTVNGAGTPFAASDVYEIGINSQKKGYDATLDVNKVIEQSPLWARYTSPELLVTASDIGAADGVYVDQGAEISMNGYTKLGIFVKFTVSDSTTNTIKVLSKHASAGAEEFVLESAGDYIKTLGDANINIFYEFETNGIIPTIQIQSAAADVDTGGGTEGTLEIYIVKGWN